MEHPARNKGHARAWPDATQAITCMLRAGAKVRGVLKQAGISHSFLAN